MKTSFPPITSRYNWLLLLGGLLLINWAATSWHFQVDLTEERRFSLSQPTKQLLRGLDSDIYVEVFLKGDLPAEFRNLRNATGDLLREMQDVAGDHLQFEMIKPGEGLTDSLQAQAYDSLEAMGLKPYTVTVSSKPGEESSQRMIFPAAIIHYGDRALPIDLLSISKRADKESAINDAESLLEFKLADAINKLTRRQVPRVAYLLGNGEPMDLHSIDAISTLAQNYIPDTLTLWRTPLIPLAYSAVIITKPLRPFSETDKLKIDQYVMYGGKVIWLIDNLYAEMDSLEISQQFIAFDRGLNLQDQLFKYGVRINEDLIQDLQCDQIPLAVGSIGGKPQMQAVDWYYSPLLNPSDNNPISRNLDPVLGIFVNSIDTVKAVGIQKTFLLRSSDNAHRVNTPVLVSFESVKQTPDPSYFNQAQIPAAVLLEGVFHSSYENRLPGVLRDSLQRLGQPFLPVAKASTKMIVIADGDLILNAVSKEHGPLPMGTNPFTNEEYANKDFFLNCMEYLTSQDGIIETRNKQLVMRNLDKKKVEDERTQWQLINIALPVILVILIGFIYQQIRKRKYQK